MPPARRAHRKSRQGCLECKRRHIKCDEGRPACGNCSISDRRCSFPAEPAAPGTRGTTPGDSTSDASTSLVAASPKIPPPSLAPSMAVPSPVHVNMHHMELLNYFVTTEQKRNTPELVEAVMQSAFGAPYLMYQCLSFAATQLSVLKPARQEFYLNQSSALQIEAISLFNSVECTSPSTLDQSIPMFIFSVILSIHVLSNTVRLQDPEKQDFLTKFIMYLHVHRGVRSVCHQTWNGIKTAKGLSSMLTFTDMVPGPEWQGPDVVACGSLFALLSRAELSEKNMAACKQSILDLCWAFMVHCIIPTDANVIISWPIMMSDEYAKLLNRRTPEALVILAYYGRLLHEKRHIWFVGAAGRLLIESICAFLGEFWEPWLAWPREVLGESAPEIKSVIAC